jgi:hypothetical protein
MAGRFKKMNPLLHPWAFCAFHKNETPLAFVSILCISKWWLRLFWFLILFFSFPFFGWYLMSIIIMEQTQFKISKFCGCFTQGKHTLGGEYSQSKCPYSLRLMWVLIYFGTPYSSCITLLHLGTMCLLPLTNNYPNTTFTSLTWFEVLGFSTFKFLTYVLIFWAYIKYMIEGMPWK